ncbi:right-handed parallel beta-helix repeat-containing protein [Methylocapsa sp. S129]|uniref:right-handed parallel beta-helix repeat-containing protein n=1 Tax=Methylocapsa sp. S129 TaxID=1641869 RepID=UPI00131C3DE8|nr:right-handed parallel beta-helix repeat-containing protein [Methylocapsa sp. S129]
MIKTLFLAAAALSAVCLDLATTQATSAATLNRAWVSGHGNDVAGCSAPTNPCRSLQYVVTDVIAPGGEIDILDPAGYGAVTIPFALSIVNDGVGTAGVQATSGAAITINAGLTDTVTLRGLDIDGLGSGAYGVLMNSGGVLTVVNCVIRHFTSTGVNIAPGSGTTTVSISNTIASDNGYAGIGFDPSGTGIVNGVISQTTVANNAHYGVSIFNYGGGSASATIVDSLASNNVFGFGAENAAASLLLGHSVATGNSQAGVYLTASATGQTYGDNKLSGNGAPSSLLSSVAMQ